MQSLLPVTVDSVQPIDSRCILFELAEHLEKSSDKNSPFYFKYSRVETGK